MGLRPIHHDPELTLRNGFNLVPPFLDLFVNKIIHFLSHRAYLRLLKDLVQKSRMHRLLRFVLGTYMSS